jgi:hypothetical protein
VWIDRLPPWPLPVLFRASEPEFAWSSSASFHSGTVSVAEQISASRRISNHKADSSTSSTAPLSLLMKSARDFARLAIVRGSGRCRVRQLGRDFVVDVILRNRSGTPNHVDSEFL